MTELVGTASPLVVEVVGPPGSGKSTIVRSLLVAGNGRVGAVTLGGWWSAPLLLRNAVFVAPPFVQQLPRLDRRRWNRFALMVQLRTLDDLLVPERNRGLGAVLLDQGPVYMLSILQRALRGGGKGGDSRAFLAYWERTLAEWARRLDCVVELEADDRELYRRIRRRDTPHPVLAMRPVEVSAFMASSRYSRERILRALRRGGRGPRLVRVRTDGHPPGSSVGRILSELRIAPSGDG